MRKIISFLIAIVFFGSINSYSQNNLAISSFSISNPTPGNCDGFIVIDSIQNGVPPYVFNLYYQDSQSGGLILSTSGNSFYNLCKEAYYLEFYDSDCNFAAIQFQIDTIVGNPLSFHNLSVISESSPGACDGSVSVEINDYLTSSLTLEIYDLQSGTVVNEVLNVNTSPMVVNNLCLVDSLGVYLFAYDSNYDYWTDFESRNLDQWPTMQSLCNTFTIWTETSTVFDTTFCDGTATTFAYGGQPPYTYEYSSGGTNHMESNLCSGVYTVEVKDSNNDSLTTTFVVAAAANFIQFNMITNPYDTLYSNALQNCSLDYTMSIDSARLDSMYYLSSTNLRLRYTLFQGTNEFVWAENYYVDTTANYIVALSFYCENRSFDDIKTILIGLPLPEMMTLQLPQLKPESFDVNFEIYPNPSENIFQIDFETKESSSLTFELTDITGKLIHSINFASSIGKNHLSLDLNQFASGLYLLNVRNEKGLMQSKKLIKN